MLNLLLSLFVASSVVSSAASHAVPVSSSNDLDTVTVSSRPLRLRDETRTGPEGTVLTNPTGNLDLAPALERFPGVSTRQSSGPASLLRVFSAYGLNSGQTQNSVDGIPLVNPLGTGANLALIPTSLVWGLDFQSPFAANLDPHIDPRPAPGGRLNMALMSQSMHAHPKLGGELLLSSPGALKTNLSGRVPVSSRAVLDGGATFLTTNGRYPYQNVSTRTKEQRQNNHATGAGVTLGSQHKLGAAKQTALGSRFVYSRFHRAVPGSLTFSTNEKEQDDLAIVGLTLDHNAVHSKLSATHTRTKYISDGHAMQAVSHDVATTAFGQVNASVFDHNSAALWLGADHENTRLNSGIGRFYRAITGLTVRGRYTYKNTALLPLFRQELSNQYSGARDYRVTLAQEFHPRLAGTVSFGYDHVYPSITALTGYVGPFGRVLGNPALGVERHRQFQAALVYEQNNFRTVGTFFHNHVSSMAGYSFNSNGSAQFVAAPRVRVIGGVAETTWQPLQWFTLRSALTMLRAQDLNTKLDAPYKPRLHGLVGLGIRPTKPLLLTAEATGLSSRRVGTTEDSSRGDPRLPPQFTMGVRADYQVTKELMVFARITNLLDRGLEDYPGYPAPGRTYYVGLSF